MFLDHDTFLVVVNNTPLVSIDLIARDSRNKILLGKRMNEPVVEYWFVPGGQVLKDEAFVQALERLTAAESGQKFSIEQA